jgi:hypothetical protein
MTEEPEFSEEDLDDVELPDDPVEDLDVDEDESGDVGGGAFKQGWPPKWTG